MDYDFTPEQKAWRQEIRDFVRKNVTADMKIGMEFEREETPAMKAWKQLLRDKGWIGIAWPKEYGGLGRPAMDSWILVDELMQNGLPAPIDLNIGPTLIQIASDEMKAEFLPKVLSGEASFILGYSEPNAGSDLASLETRAVLDGDEFVINGSKIWNSSAHRGTHEWLAVRTDPKVPKHKGISVIIVPIDSPGITIRPIYTWGDARTNQTFFDNVRVPRKNLVGEINQGWFYINAALARQRGVVVGATGDLLCFFEQFLDYIKSTERNGQRLSKDPIIRNQVAKLATEIKIARLLSLRVVMMLEKGQAPSGEVSMVKIFNTELRQRIGDIGTQIQGLYGQLKKGSEDAPLDGDVEITLRLSAFQVFAGGNNDIQRDIIARRGLGLPRGGGTR